MTALLVKAVAKTLKKHPQVNSSFQKMEFLIQKI